MVPNVSLAPVQIDLRFERLERFELDFFSYSLCTQPDPLSFCRSQLRESKLQAGLTFVKI